MEGHEEESSGSTSSEQLDENIIKQLHDIFDTSLDCNNVDALHNIIRSHGFGLLTQILMTSDYKRSVELHNRAIMIHHNDLIYAAPSFVDYNKYPCIYASGFAQTEHNTEPTSKFMYVHDSNGGHFGILQIHPHEYVTRFTSQDEAASSLLIYHNNGWHSMLPEDILKSGKLVIE